MLSCVKRKLGKKSNQRPLDKRPHFAIFTQSDESMTHIIMESVLESILKFTSPSTDSRNAPGQHRIRRPADSSWDACDQRQVVPGRAADVELIPICQFGSLRKSPVGLLRLEALLKKMMEDRTEHASYTCLFLYLPSFLTTASAIKKPSSSPFSPATLCSGFGYGAAVG